MQDFLLTGSCSHIFARTLRSLSLSLFLSLVESSDAMLQQLALMFSNDGPNVLAKMSGIQASYMLTSLFSFPLFVQLTFSKLQLDHAVWFCTTAYHLLHMV